jgi:hypothetical protein
MVFASLVPPTAFNVTSRDQENVINVQWVMLCSLVQPPVLNVLEIVHLAALSTLLSVYHAPKDNSLMLTKSAKNVIQPVLPVQMLRSALHVPRVQVWWDQSVL